MHEPEFLLFASEAEMAAIWGGVFILLAIIAMIAEQVRVKRKKIDSVGWMPWTAIFFACAFIGASLLLVALKGWNAP